MARTKQSLLDEAARIEKQLDGGKIKGKTSQAKFRMKMHNLRWRASKKSEKAAKAKAPKIPKVAKGQGILPGFLDQLTDVRVDEMVRELLFKRIEKEVNERVDRFLKVVG